MLVRLIVVLVIIAQAVPALAVAGRRPSSMGDSCPMMAHRATEEPCLAAPCPCEHGSDGTLLLSAAVPGLLDRPASLPAPARRRGPETEHGAPRPGHPFDVDHPPTI